MLHNLSRWPVYWIYYHHVQRNHLVIRTIVCWHRACYSFSFSLMREDNFLLCRLRIVSVDTLRSKKYCVGTVQFTHTCARTHASTDTHTYSHIHMHTHAHKQRNTWYRNPSDKDYLVIKTTSPKMIFTNAQTVFFPLLLRTFDSTTRPPQY